MRTSLTRSNTRKSGVLLACTLLVVTAMAAAPAWAQVDCDDQEGQTREDLVFCRSQEALLDYMRESVARIGQGHELAYQGFEGWYVNRLMPGLDGAPAIEKVFKYVVEKLFLGGASSIIPYKGVFIVDLLDGFSNDAYAELSASMGGVRSQQGFLKTLDLQLAKYKSSILELPNQFEMQNPDLFEDLMFKYTDEELETPGIHYASDFRMGAETREMLDHLGFPEPSEEAKMDLAEHLLIAMVYEAQMKYHSKGLNEIWGPEQYEISARIAARRVLYPDDPDYYCQGSGMLGSIMTPKDCRR